ncbi:hypothetical protein M0638_24680 [Roseomonas sp. NAR14]|uniref:Uncharacterized protein n=1 Tax=Roseomonas acroporae TaxID=2937791 RepID=A0A9X1YCE1_9PROT|nr:hypothetical protein [Roseomonas acroporae]
MATAEGSWLCLRCLLDRKGCGSTAAVKETATIGGNLLAVSGTTPEVVASFIVATADPCTTILTLKKSR